MGQEYRRTKTTVSLINFHFVFYPSGRTFQETGHGDLQGEPMEDPCHGSDAGTLSSAFNLSTNGFSIRYYGNVERGDLQKTETRI
jgi:hypothetical protein